MISAARSRSIARGLASAAVVSLVLGSAAPARGQEGGGEVLHEFIERPVDLPDPPRRPSAGAPPQERADRPGRRPRLTLARRSGEMVLGASGPAYQSLRSPYGPLDPRGGRVRLDAQTSRVGGLDYHAVFKPSVYPYKRGVAQNRVHVADDGYQMSAQSGRLREVTIGGSPPEGADVFWGSFLVRARSGHLHPVPSVAPSQRVLAVETEPQAGVDVLRDEADNFYLEIDHDGLVRVNLRVAAPTFYFDGALDRSVRWRDFRGLEQTSLPEPLRAPAREALATTGVSRRSSPRRAVRRLVRYFRSFEVRALPTSARSGDLLTTIVERKVGVCRHRSMAFVVLARRLGVPARYVYNEAHAFVEIGWPGRGWRRIDLGGAAGDLRFSGARNSRLHRGSATDSLPRPPGYRSVAGGGRGEEERAERAGPRGDRAG
ncbi:MAG: transglutaminase family protein, partial [Bradymonadaceae bacterium]